MKRFIKKVSRHVEKWKEIQQNLHDTKQSPEIQNDILLYWTVTVVM